MESPGNDRPRDGTDIDKYTVFTHLSAPRAADYRRLLGLFAAKRREFVINLRHTELSADAGLDEEETEALLEQLHEWGNLDRAKDRADAMSIEAYYRAKWLYQLSERGEAAEQALAVFGDALGQRGELQSGALRKIIEFLAGIENVLGDNEPPADPAAVDVSSLLDLQSQLDQRFEEFTTQAQRFMRSLLGSIELHGLSEDDFLVYKDRLIEYLERFLHDLAVSGPEIADRVRRVERAGLPAHFPRIARLAREDALDPDDPGKLADELAHRRGRWNGLRQWFLGDANGRSQSEMLRARTREAIPAMLTALQSFHDRRESGSDRRRDWRQLARWFAETPSDAEAHRLWRVAFALAPSRHLRVNEETLDRREECEESPRTPWLEAEPMWLAPQLRAHGRSPSSAPPRPVVDLSEEREYLRQQAERENAQIAQAHAQLVTDGVVRLSAFAILDPAAFRLLLDLLGRAVTQAETGRAATVTSTDGSLEIALTPPADPSARASLRTTEGLLQGPDFSVSIQPAHSGAFAARDGGSSVA